MIIEIAGIRRNTPNYWVNNYISILKEEENKRERNKIDKFIIGVKINKPSYDITGHHFPMKMTYHLVLS